MPFMSHTVEKIYQKNRFLRMSLFQLFQNGRLKMYNTEAIKQKYNSLAAMAALAESYGAGLKPKGQKEMTGPCPACGGRDRFNIQAGRWLCRHCTGGRWRDVFALVTLAENLDLRRDFRQVCRRLGGVDEALLSRKSPAVPRPAPPTFPPSAAWQERARAFVTYAQEQLWAEFPRPALTWLRDRTLADETIRQARLGWNPEPLHDKAGRWGFLPEHRPIWLPRGLVIPWFAGGYLWRVNIRRPDDDLARDHRPGLTRPAKYIGPAGYAQGLYNADALRPGQPAILVEGEIDCLTIAQHAPKLVVPVATGATTHAWRPRWIAKLLTCSQVLLAFDADGHDGRDGQAATKGEAAAIRWQSILPNAIRWRPLWGDPNQMAHDGANIRAWIMAGLSPTSPKPFKVIIWSTDQPLATIQGQTRPLPDGRLEAWYYSQAELAQCLDLTRFARQLTKSGSTGSQGVDQ
jgi:hypothetical protein